MGWADDERSATRRDGRQFEVLVTVEKSMQFQQRLDDRPIGVLLLRAKQPGSRLAAPGTGAASSARQ
jgi:hypothetical protein